MKHKLQVVEFDESNEIQDNSGAIVADVWLKEYSQLLAAAPELLDALKDIVIKLGDVNLVATNSRNQRIHDKIYKYAMDAINKAEGK